MNLSEFRAQYPQYSDLTDQQLADGLYSKYYSDLDRNSFYSSIGLQPEKPQPTGPRVLSETDTSSDFFRGVRNIPGQLQEAYGAVRALTGKATGDTELVKSGIESMEAGQARQTVRESDSFTNAWDKGISTVVTDWLPYQVGAGVGSVLESLAFMLGGAGAGAVTGGGVGAIPGAAAGLVGKALVKKGVMEAAKKEALEKGERAAQELIEREAKTVLTQAGKRVGATAGLAGQAGLYGFGETAGRAIEEAGGVEGIGLERVIPAGLVSTIAEFIGDKIALGALKINPASTKNLALDIAKNIAVTGVKETPVELIQTAAERYGARLSLEDAEALKEYVDTVAAALGMSVGPGAIGGVRTRIAGAEADARRQFEADRVAQTLQQTAPPATPLTPEQEQAEAEQKARLEELLARDIARDIQTQAPVQEAPVQEETTKKAEAPIDTALEKSITTQSVLSALQNKIELGRGGNAIVYDIPGTDFVARVPKGSALPATSDAVVTVADPFDGKNFGQPVAKVGEIQILRRQNGIPAGLAIPKNLTQEEADTQYATAVNAAASMPQSAFDKFAADLMFLNSRGASFDPSKSNNVLIDPNSGQFNLVDINQNKAKDYNNSFADMAITLIGNTYAYKYKGSESLKSAYRQIYDKSLIAAKKTGLEIDKDSSSLKYSEKLAGVEAPSTTPFTGAPSGTQAPQTVETKEEGPEAPVEGAAVEGAATPAAPAVKPVKPAAVAPEIVELYDEARQEDVDADKVLPAWKDLNTAERDFYLGNIARNTYQEHLEAVNQLRSFREAAKGEKKVGEQKIAVSYEEDRSAQSDRYELDLPRWNELPDAARAAYVDAINKAADKKRGPTGEERDAAFEKTVEALEATGQYARGVRGRTAEALKEKAQEKEAKEKATQRMAEEQAIEEREKGKGGELSPNVQTMLRRNQLTAALLELSKSAQGMRVYLAKGIELTGTGASGKKAVSRFSTYQDLIKLRQDLSSAVTSNLVRSLRDLILKDPTKIPKIVTGPEVDARLAALKQLGEYDPKTNTIYLSKWGMDEATLLHEVVHAVTAQTITLYLTDPSALTDAQREAMQHLQKIFDVAKPKLRGQFRPAFENLYEFVAYALSDTRFQAELAAIQSRPLAKYTSKPARLFTQFMKMFMRLFDLLKPKATPMELKPEWFDAIAEDFNKNRKAKKDLYEVEAIDEEKTKRVNLDEAFAQTEEQAVDQAVVDEEIQEQKREIAKLKAERSKATGQKRADLDRQITELKKDLNDEIASKTFEVKQSKTFLSLLPGFEGNALIETVAAFQHIVAPPTVVNIDALPATALKATPLGGVDFNNPPVDYELGDREKPRNAGSWLKILTSSAGWQRITRNLQNDRYFIKRWEDFLSLANKTVYDGPRLNNIYGQITLATGKSRDYYLQDVQPAYERLENAIDRYAKASNTDIDKVLAQLHVLTEALHEPERRMIKYMRLVPLTPKAATLRDNIFEELKKGRLSQADALSLRKRLNAVIFKNLDADGNPVNYETTDNVDKFGTSPIQSVGKDGTVKGVSTDFYPTDAEDPYQVTAMDKKSVDSVTQQYKSSIYVKELSEILSALKNVTDVTGKLDRVANYWSEPVSNHVYFYNFQHYVPLKGRDRTKKAGVTEFDEMLDPNSRAMGGEAQDAPFSMEGRATVSDNPILQALSDSVRASVRAGRKDVTLAVKNSLDKDDKKNPNGQNLLAGKVREVIPFIDRDKADLIKYKTGQFIFHYEKNGDIYILEVADENYRESIRRTYRQSDPLVEGITAAANNITSFIGKTHTRYNYQFAPKNFVTDAFTNAFTIGAEMGPKAAADFLSTLANRVVFHNGLFKAMTVAAMYGKGDPASRAALERKARDDAYIRDMLDYVEAGGMVSYLAGMTLKSQFQELYKQIGRNGIVRTAEQANRFIDIWNDMFELASRSAAFASVRDRYIKQGMSESEARTKAAAYVKNLANFEQVGKWGKTLGSLFMFFRPASTGAVRAIEALIPAVQSVETAIEKLPAEAQKDPQAVAAFKKNYLERQRNARVMASGLVGLGALAYMMALMMSDDDDLGRNAVANDNMQQWTRYARFHIPRSITKELGIEDPVIVQIPWGFGLGAFAAAGAQAMSAMFGSAKTSDALANVFLQISFDSFIPLPISRMPATEMPLQFALDSITPSFARPLLEFAMNKNGLGQDIYNDRNRRFGDAYTGGDKIPDIYKDAARYFVDQTDGGIDISPNTLYFLANSYADGFARLLLEMPYGVSQVTAGERAFNPKQDIPLLGSFFGTRGSVDAREFAQVEKQIAEKERRLKMFATNPPKYADYVSKHPFDEILVKSFNEQVGGQLNKLRQEANEVRRAAYYDATTKRALLQVNAFQQNLVKHDMVEKFKAYGIEP